MCIIRYFILAVVIINRSFTGDTKKSWFQVSSVVFSTVWLWYIQKMFSVECSKGPLVRISDCVLRTLCLNMMLLPVECSRDLSSLVTLFWMISLPGGCDAELHIQFVFSLYFSGWWMNKFSFFWYPLVISYKWVLQIYNWCKVRYWIKLQTLIDFLAMIFLNCLHYMKYSLQENWGCDETSSRCWRSGQLCIFAIRTWKYSWSLAVSSGNNSQCQFWHVTWLVKSLKPRILRILPLLNSSCLSVCLWISKRAMFRS